MPRKFDQQGVSMNPIRALFLSLSRLPPALMLLIIMGLAVTVTMMVTARISSEERQFLAANRSDEITTSGAQPAAQSVRADLRNAVVSRKPIPEGTEIDATYLRIRKVEEGSLWEDSFPSTDKVLGRVAKVSIPAGNQIRAIDVE